MLYTVFDIETTGLDSYRCDIIQFAYVTLDDNFKMVDCDNLYFYKKDMSWSMEAEAVHHISKSFLKQYEDMFEQNLLKMYKVLCRSNSVTYNGDHFDIPFCKTWLKRNGAPEIIIDKSFDVMKIYQPVFKKKVKLIKLPELIGLPKEIIEMQAKSWFGYSGDAHDASYDITATALAFTAAIRNKYTSNGKSVLSPEEARALSVFGEKGYITEEDFTSMSCWKVKNGSNTYIVNECNDKDAKVYFKIPIESVPEIIKTNSYNGLELPIEFVNSIITASENVEMVADTNSSNSNMTVYVYEIMPGLKAKVTDDSFSCKYSVVRGE